MSSPVSIRRAAPQDLDALCRIEQECFAEDAFTRPQLYYLLARAHGGLFIALHDGKVAGYISLLLRRNTCNVRIYSVAVAPECRSCGVAKELVGEALRFAESERRTCVTLEVRCDNAAAIALYEGFGFCRTEQLPHYYHGGGDGWRMKTSLPDDKKIKK